ncbi:MAG: nitrile hydratase accessory protein [Pseudohongiellaceae bacterium]
MIEKTSPFQPCDSEGPVFNEPWEAQAFGLVIALHQSGAFTWEEWAAQLSEEITVAAKQGDPDLGDTYYHHWLKALEKLVQSKSLSSCDEIAARVSQWRNAYLNTPHGSPIELHNGHRST